VTSTCDLDSVLAGTTVRSSASFTNIAGAAADPPTVIVTWLHPDGTTEAFTYGTNAEVVRDSIGHFHCDLLVEDLGQWAVRWDGVGQIVGDLVFSVLQGVMA
jgi:hypothetical protein